jgi:uncharacterized protein YecT (DUF1311 family)
MQKIFLPIIFLMFFNSCHAENKNATSTCDPSIISRESTCNQYLKLDSALNEEYKKLINSLQKEDTEKLRASQREWIKWRTARCNEAQENSGCKTGSCIGVEHDSCILQLTFTRTSELKKFLESPNEGKSLNFEFSKKTKFDDE